MQFVKGKVIFGRIARVGEVNHQHQIVSVPVVNVVREIKGPPEDSLDTLAVQGKVPLGLKWGERDVVNDGDSLLETILLLNKDIDQEL